VGPCFLLSFRSRRGARAASAVLALALWTVACAHLGLGDPKVVRAEDVLSNSLAVYSAAMDWHFKHSTAESPAAYKAFEAFRTNFPAAWAALDNAKRGYQYDKSQGTATLDASLNALSALVSAILPLIGTK
jgi:hypothetical protein